MSRFCMLGGKSATGVALAAGSTVSVAGTAVSVAGTIVAPAAAATVLVPRGIVVCEATASGPVGDGAGGGATVTVGTAPAPVSGVASAAPPVGGPVSCPAL